MTLFEMLTKGLYTLIIFLFGMSAGIMGKKKAKTDVITESDMLYILTTLTHPLDVRTAVEAVGRMQEQGVVFREATKK